jgi:MATE family multidrug resistance protein
MVPLAFSHAATVRVARAFGADDIPAARLAGWVAIGCGIVFMTCVGIVLMTTPQTIVALYIDLADPANAEVIPIALHLLFITALFAVFDGVQGVASGVLRGLHDTRAPLVIATLGYWGAGFVPAWLLAFPLGFGAVGLWWGLALGLAVVAIGLCLRFHRLTAA